MISKSGYLDRSPRTEHSGAHAGHLKCRFLACALCKALVYRLCTLRRVLEVLLDRKQSSGASSCCEQPPSVDFLEEVAASGSTYLWRLPAELAGPLQCRSTCIEEGNLLGTICARAVRGQHSLVITADILKRRCRVIAQGTGNLGSNVALLDDCTVLAAGGFWMDPSQEAVPLTVSETFAVPQ